MQLQYKSLFNQFKNVGKEHKCLTTLDYNWLFFLSLSNILCWFWSLKKTKAIMYASIKQTVLILMKYSMLCAWTFPKFWGDLNDQKYNVPFLILFEHTSTPTKIRIQTKTIWHSITCDTHIISWNYDISYSLACQKTWGKEFKHLKTLRIGFFFQFYHSLDFYEIKYELYL